MNTDNNSTAKYAGAVIAAAVYAYVVLRGYYVPPFCDEVVSFFDFIRPGDMQPFYARLDANNHVVNSVLSRLFYLLFGGEIFVLRLPNMLAFGGYLYFLFKFRTFFKHPWIWLAWFCAMVIPQYFLDFFHLSRGYGLSMAFLMGSVFHLFAFYRDLDWKNFVAGLILLSLAVWSNLSIVLSAIILGSGFMLCLLVLHTKKITLLFRSALSLSFVLLFCIPMAYAVVYGFALKDVGMLYYGADADFWENSVIYGTQFLIYNWTLSGWVTIGVLVLLAFVSVTNTRKQGTDRTLFIHATLWGSLAALLVIHHWLGVKYPIDRATIHLYLLLFMGLFLELDRTEFRVLRVFGYGISVSLLLLTVTHANLTHTRLWGIEHVPKKYYERIVEWKEENGVIPNIGVDGLHLKVLKYYDFLNNGILGIVDDPIYPGTLNDLVIIKNNIHTQVSQLIFATEQGISCYDFFFFQIVIRSYQGIGSKFHFCASCC